MTLPNALRWFFTILVLLSIAKTAWSGIRPGPDDPKAWYDRLIRSVGGIIVLAFLLALAIVTHFQRVNR